VDLTGHGNADDQSAASGAAIRISRCSNRQALPPWRQSSCLECADRAEVIAMFAITTPALAESPCPTPTRDGRELLPRIGACPSGYVGLGNKCEALHRDTPRAYPYIPGTACPSGTFRSGDNCREFH